MELDAMTLKNIKREADYYGLAIRSTKTHYLIMMGETELARVAKSEGLVKLQKALDKELYAISEIAFNVDGSPTQWR